MAKQLPDVCYPLPVRLLFRSYDNAVAPAIYNVGTGFVLPKIGKEKPRVVYGGFNMWLDNNCCGSVSISAMQARVMQVSDGWVREGQAILSWSPSKIINDDSVFSRKYLLDPDKSPLPHLTALDPDFPELTDTQLEKWYAGYLCAGVVSMMRWLHRYLVNSIDRENGTQSRILKMMGAAMRADSFTPISYLDMNTHEEYGRPTIGGYPEDPEPMRGRVDQVAVYEGHGCTNWNSGNIIRPVTIVGHVTDDNLPKGHKRFDLDQRSYTFENAPQTRARSVRNKAYGDKRGNYLWCLSKNIRHYV